VPPDPDSAAAEVSLRASDRERDATVTRLRDACGEGRLSVDEFTERMDLAYRSRTTAELARLTSDLPEEPASEPAPPSPARRAATRWTVAVMSGIERRGRWRVERRTAAVAVMGGATLDLRNAHIEGAEVEIVAVALMGGIEIIVPEDADVDVTGFALMGGKEVKVKEGPPVPGAPTIRVQAYPVMGGIEVKSKPSPKRELPPPQAPGLPGPFGKWPGRGP